MHIITKILTLCVLTLTWHTSSAFAQSAPAEDEKIIFAFLKLSDQSAPDLTDWIKQSKLYKRTDYLLKSDLLEKEKTRLQAALSNHDAKRTPLRIQTEIKLHTNKNKDREQILYFQFPDERSLEIPYFPYDYGEQKIAFIIDGLKSHTQITLGPKQTKAVKKHFLDESNYIGTLDITLRPLSADAANPLPIDGEDHFLLIGDIAHIEFRYYDKHDNADLILWDYTAPWYKTAPEEQ